MLTFPKTVRREFTSTRSAAHFHFHKGQDRGLGMYPPPIHSVGGPANDPKEYCHIGTPPHGRGQPSSLPVGHCLGEPQAPSPGLYRFLCRPGPQGDPGQGGSAAEVCLLCTYWNLGPTWRRPGEDAHTRREREELQGPRALGETGGHVNNLLPSNRCPLEQPCAASPAGIRKRGEQTVPSVCPSASGPCRWIA